MHQDPHDQSASSRFLKLGFTFVAVSVACPVSGQADLVINEVFYRSSEAQLEYVELLNIASSAVDLNDYLFSDDRLKPVELVDHSRRIEPGGMVVLTRNAEIFDANFSFSDRIQIPSWPVLNNGGDSVVIWRGASSVDSMRYSSSWGGNDYALERIDPFGPSWHRANWAESLDRLGGTPGRKNSVYAPDRAPPEPIFAEESLEGDIIVTFDETLDPTSITLDAFTLSDGSRPTRVTLVATDQTGGTNRVVRLAVRSAENENYVAITGIGDLSGNRVEDSVVEIAHQPRANELLINEVMYEPLADAFDGRADQPEYVELASTSGRYLTLRSLLLTDALRENGERDTLRLTQHHLASSANSFIILHDRPHIEEDPWASFETLDRASQDLVLIEFSNSALSLPNGGETIRLVRSDGLVIDEVHYDPAWHLPERIETRGISLERVTSTRTSNLEGKWTSSVHPDGGTPGAQNSVWSAPASSSQLGLSVTPSPFSPNADGHEDFAVIQLAIDRPTALARVMVYDLAGRRVTTISEAWPVTSSSQIVWDGRDSNGQLSSTGVYILFVEVLDSAAGWVQRFKLPVVLVRDP